MTEFLSKKLKQIKGDFYMLQDISATFRCYDMFVKWWLRQPHERKAVFV